MFEIFYETHFSASHQIHGYRGVCSGLHGHTWKVAVEFRTHRTDEIGISFDFKEIKEIVQTVIERLDHKHINEISPFNKKNPTAEYLAQYIYEEVRKLIPDHIQMSKVTVWESDKYGVTYLEDSND